MKKFFVTYASLVLAFVYLPIFVLIVYSFNSSAVSANWEGFTLEWYAKLFQNTYVIDAAINSITIALTSTVITTIIGTLCALALHRYRFKFKGVIEGVLYLPLLVPEILMGLSLLVLFTQFQVSLSMMTVIIAHVTFSISYVVVILSARLKGAGPELEQAASDLGATPWQTFRHVTLPTMMPGIFAAALLTFTLSIDDFIISFFVAGPESTTLPLYIYGLVKKGVSPEINALSTILIVVIVALMLLSEVIGSKGSDDEKGSSTIPF